MENVQRRVTILVKTVGTVSYTDRFKKHGIFSESVTQSQALTMSIDNVSSSLHCQKWLAVFLRTQ